MQNNIRFSGTRVTGEISCGNRLLSALPDKRTCDKYTIGLLF